MYEQPEGARLFDKLAAKYDQWFDLPKGQAIFEVETACLRELIADRHGRWLEVGVGTGRFAQALGVQEGVDPSAEVLRFAAARGIHTRLGAGENLPYDDAEFDGVLMVVTICFLADPQKTLEECSRILRPDGSLLVGLVPADSPWGELYAREGREGHPFYSVAKFYTCEDVINLAAKAGFSRSDARSGLFTHPGEAVVGSPPRKGIVPGAGFVAMKFRKVQ